MFSAPVLYCVRCVCRVFTGCFDHRCGCHLSTDEFDVPDDYVTDVATNVTGPVREREKKADGKG